MRYAGKITEWNDARGFGFVVPNGGGDRAFLHISAFRSRSRRPAVGDRVTYAVGKDARGRLQARTVGFVEAKRSTPAPRPVFSRARIGFAALAAVAMAWMTGGLPSWLAGAYGVLSGVSFLAYAIDKKAATSHARRTPEHTLHMLDLLGGWPGGLIAQQRFRHKTIKQPFQFVFWFSVVANIGGTWWLVTSGVAARLSASIVG